MGLEFNIALNINTFIFSEGAFVERVTMRGHKRALQLLEWTCKRMDWFLAEDSDEEFETYEHPGLGSLRKEYALSLAFDRSCFHPHRKKAQSP